MEQQNKGEKIKLVYGHVLRLPDNTPANIALREVRKYVKKSRGGQKLTWIKTIEKDLERARVMVAKVDGTIFVATDECLANIRPLWQSIVSRAMLKETECVSDRYIDRDTQCSRTGN